MIAHLSNFFASRSVDVSIVCTSANPKQNYETDSSVNVFVLSKEKVSVFKKILLFRNCVKQIKPDIIISFLAHSSVYAFCAKGINKSKVVVSERNSPADAPSKLPLRIFRNLSYRMADRVVFQCEGAKEYFKKPIRDKGEVIFNPIRFDALPTANFENHRFVAAGRITNQKNYRLLLNAYKKYSQAMKPMPLVIFGKDYSNGSLEKDIASLKLESLVIHKDFTPNIWQEFASSSVYCLSSIFEGMPNALLEAASIGLPIITTDYRPGGVESFVKTGYNGIVCRNGNVDDYFNAMCQISSHLEEYQNRALEYRKQIERMCNIEKIGNQWLSLFNSLLAK